MFVQYFQHAKCHKAPWIIISALSLKPEWGVIEYKLQCKIQSTISNTMQNPSKLDCKTQLIHLYLISSLPLKGLPFKITFTTCREGQHCHWGMVADEFFLRGKWPTLGGWWKARLFSSCKEMIQQQGFFYCWEDFETLFCFEGMWKRQEN